MPSQLMAKLQKCYELRDHKVVQIGVSTWDAAGFLGMSEKTLRDVYGHHHPDYLQGAAKAIGTKKPVSLVKSLVRPHQRRPLSPQHTENIGGPARIKAGTGPSLFLHEIFRPALTGGDFQRASFKRSFSG